MIQIFSPDVGQEELAAIQSVFASSWLGRGQREAHFKSGLATLLEVKVDQLCLSSSCTELIFAFTNLFVPREKTIALPTISFPSIGSAILEYGIPYTLIDVDEQGNISLDGLARATREHDIGAVFLTHYGSGHVNVAEVRRIVGDDALILEDSACALGGMSRGRAIGTEGDFACWSFDAMKLITTGDGGMGYCRKPEHAAILREYLYLGLPESEKSGLDKSRQGSGWWEYELLRPGRRAILNDVAAAMGIAQLDKIGSFLQKRRENWTILHDGLKHVPGLSMVNAPSQESSAYYFTINTTQRDRLALHLKDRGVYSTFRYWPLHRMNLFRSSGAFPMADQMAAQFLNLPCHHKLSRDDLETIIGATKAFFGSK